MTWTTDYDTTIRTVTHTVNQDTIHRECIDWTYPFDDPEHTRGMCSSDEAKREYIEQLKMWLRQIESGEATYASDYGGWPRIWKKVLGVCMASAWPYWKPRPCVRVAGTLGIELIDWASLTGVKEENPR